MTNTGERILFLRQALGLTQKQLAEELGISEKSIHRYETKERSMDLVVLKKLAAYFGVSVDYLLGTLPYEKQLEEEYYIKSPSLYKRIVQCKQKKYIDPECSYYCVFIDRENCVGGQTTWAGWADADHTYEVRRLRPINPAHMFEASSRLQGTPLIVNTVDDIEVFYLLGGTAIVRTDLCESHMPEFCKDYIVEKGFHD